MQILTQHSLVTDPQFKRTLVDGEDPVPVMHEDDIRCWLVQRFTKSLDNAPERVILPSAFEQNGPLTRGMWKTRGFS